MSKTLTQKEEEDIFERWLISYEEYVNRVRRENAEEIFKEISETFDFDLREIALLIVIAKSYGVATFKKVRK
jgi:hypothetical protein